MKYNVFIWPYQYSQWTFKELADSFVECIGKQHECCLSTRLIADPDTTNIIFGANDSLYHPISEEIPPNTIIVNLEQLGTDSCWDKPQYIQLLKRFQVWDYTDSNIKYLKEKGVERVSKITIGYAQCLETCPLVQEQDIDVLFVGSFNERRLALRDKFEDTGLNVLFVRYTYGQSRDHLIARSKVVINVHYYQSKILEVVRLSHLLANKKCVISEEGGEPGVNEEWKRGVVMCSYDQIVSQAMVYTRDETMRKEQETTGYNFIRNYPLKLAF